MFIAINEDIFNGYGLIAVGHTEAQATKALYKEYRATSKAWNDAGVNCKTLKAYMEEWGCNVIELDPDNPKHNASALCG